MKKLLTRKQNQLTKTSQVLVVPAVEAAVVRIAVKKKKVATRSAVLTPYPVVLMAMHHWDYCFQDDDGEVEGLIDDNPVEEASDNDDEDSDADIGKRKVRSDDEDDQLEEDDYDLIEENLGIKV